ncbi:MAG: hypothetical protein MUD01_00695 [Chloroflexaceae bacterium]|jgi:hypothetical protein|nr:hypothetical protein [Chloroflexaceae bacterium]
MDNAPLLWLIDGAASETRHYKRQLERTHQLHVQAVPLRSAVVEYADLAANPHTGAVIISQKIGQQTNGSYDSATIADFLRTLREELPLFLLASSEAEDTSPVFDGVLLAAQLEQRPEVYIPRLLRAAGRYEQALSARRRRTKELLDQQVLGALAVDEEAELAALRSYFERPADIKLAKRIEKRDAELSEKRSLVEQLESLAQKLEQANGNDS